MDDRVWDATVYTKNRARLLQGHVDERFFNAILGQAREKGLLSEEHFTVDGTLIEAWASQKSFQRKDRPKPPTDDPGNADVDFRGEKRANEAKAWLVAHGVAVIVADGGVRWVTLSGGTLFARDDATGLLVGLYRVRAPTIAGIALSAVQMRAIALHGISIAGYNYVSRQRGLTIGVYNDARQLHGMQIGLINRARNNAPGARWLPIINAHF